MRFRKYRRGTFKLPAGAWSEVPGTLIEDQNNWCLRNTTEEGYQACSEAIVVGRRRRGEEDVEEDEKQDAGGDQDGKDEAKDYEKDE